jgi:hypothetical protein
MSAPAIAIYRVSIGSNTSLATATFPIAFGNGAVMSVEVIRIYPRTPGTSAPRRGARGDRQDRHDRLAPGTTFNGNKASSFESP